MSAMTMPTPVHLGLSKGRVNRLTVRGKVAVALATALLLAGAYLAGGAVAGQTAYLPTGTVMVQPGDTLWSIAEVVTPPGGDVRDTVAVIRSLNQMTGSVLQAGDTLWVPQLEP